MQLHQFIFFRTPFVGIHTSLVFGTGHFPFSFASPAVSRGRLIGYPCRCFQFSVLRPLLGSTEGGKKKDLKAIRATKHQRTAIFSKKLFLLSTGCNSCLPGQTLCEFHLFTCTIANLSMACFSIVSDDPNFFLVTVFPASLLLLHPVAWSRRPPWQFPAFVLPLTSLHSLPCAYSNKHSLTNFFPSFMQSSVELCRTVWSL